MKLRYITCSDPREHNSIESIVKLAHMPNAEIAVQCHPSKMSPGMPRNVWFEKLLKVAEQMPFMNLAIHINTEWANDMCVNGNIPYPLSAWFKEENYRNQPIIQRVQLNMPKQTAEAINIYHIARIIDCYWDKEFIFQYNDNTKDAIRKLHDANIKFSLLFDASGGMGVAPESWQKPIYETHPMGYSGGMSPDNVVGNLRKINALVPNDTPIWIDAEGKLKSNDLFDEKPKFDIELARNYIKRANMWQKMNTRQK